MSEFCTILWCLAASALLSIHSKSLHHAIRIMKASNINRLIGTLYILYIRFYPITTPTCELEGKAWQQTVGA